jgi:copper transport protein
MDVMMLSRMPLLILMVTGFALWMASAPAPLAFAHAVPVASTPAPEAVLSQAPPQIAVRFSERVEPQASSLRVYDAHGQRVDDGNAVVHPTDPWLYQVGLRPGEGGYHTVSWRVMSADDGHVTEGAYVFTVGNLRTAPPAALSRVTPVTGWRDAFARWIGTLGAVGLIGLLIASLVFGRGQLPRVPQLSRVLPCLTALVLGVSLALSTRIQQIAPQEPLSIGLTMLMSTAAGLILAVKIGLVMVLAGVLVAYWWLTDGRTWLWLLAVALTCLLVASDALVSHSAATVGWRGLAQAAQLIHLFGIALWLGGLGYFATLFWWSLSPEQSAATELAWAIPTFSMLAVGAVGLLTASGLYLAQLHLGSADQLLSTAYGRTLVAKLGVVAPMLALGGYHQLIVQPRILASLAQNAASADLVSRRFRKTLRIEAFLGLLALLLAAVLGTTSPPHVVPSPVAEAFQQTQVVDDAQVTIAVWPLRPGPTTIRLTVTGRDGHALTDATAALLQVQPESSGVAPIGFTLEREAPGVFAKEGVVLGIEGRWWGRVTVQRQGAYDLSDRFELSLTNRSDHHAAAPAAASLASVSGFAYTGIIGLTIVLFILSKRRRSSALQRIEASDQGSVSHPDRR